MSTPRPVEHLLARAALRLYVVRLLSRTLVATIAFAGVTAAALLVARLTALLPDVLAFEHLALLPLAGLLFALLVTRRPSGDGVARVVDRELGADDLFLTVAQLESQGAPGGYSPLVLADAERRATGADASALVPIADSDPRGRASCWAIGLIALCAAGIQWLPQLDPFGKDEVRKRETARQERERERREEEQARKKQLDAKDVEAPNSKSVRHEMKQLQKVFQQAKPSQPKPFRQQLQKRQQTIAREWRKNNAQLLKRRLDRQSAAQRFGEQLDPKAKKIADQLMKGDASGFRKEMDALRKLAREMAAADPAAAAKLKKELKRRLKRLQRAMPGDEQEDPLKKSIARSLERLADMQMDDQLAQALQGMEESLELSAYEAEQLAQLLRDKEALERMLAAIQKAKALIASLKKTKAEKQKAQKSGQLGEEEQKLLDEMERLTNDLAKKQLRLAAAAMMSEDAAEKIEDATEVSNNVRSQLEELQEKAKQAAEKSAKAQTEAERKEAQAKLKQQLEQLKKLCDSMDACSQCQGDMAAYMSLLGQCKGDGPGPGGLGGRGTRRQGGGHVPEADSPDADFVRRRSPTRLTAGKMLLKWKSKRSVNRTGEAPEDYDRAMEAVVDGVSEAIRAEDIPAGYHDSIKKYFDRMRPAKPGAGQGEGAGAGDSGK